MIAKYILFIILYRDGYGHYDIITQEFYTVEQCRKNASFIQQNYANIASTYCTEK